MKIGDYVCYSIESGENLATIGYVKSINDYNGDIYVIWFNSINLHFKEGYYEPWYIRSLGGNHYESR